jgi:L-asparaginase/Glu-tRNA(Gln) amidotransferase subunit D
LKNLGAILAGDLSAAKARLLQMVALGANVEAARARTLVESALA